MAIKFQNNNLIEFKIMSKGISNSSIGRKLLMALSGFFLMVFLLQHLVINMFSVLSAELFNEVSHFMGTNEWYNLFYNRSYYLGFYSTWG